MPQFELENESGLRPMRGRTMEDALIRALHLPEDTPIEIEEQSDLHGWRKIQIQGKPAGRIRLFHRMRFRRD